MYRYSRPKSAAWGHSLRKMEPSRQKALLDEFLRLGVAEYKLYGRLEIPKAKHVGTMPAIKLVPLTSPFPELIQRAEPEFGIKSEENRFVAPNLTPSQVESWLGELISAGAIHPGAAYLESASLTAYIEISQWRMNRRSAPAYQSLLIAHFTLHPCLSTFFRFETVEDFRAIQHLLADLKFCKLDEKYLKLDKLGAREKVEREGG